MTTTLSDTYTVTYTYFGVTRSQRCANDTAAKLYAQNLKDQGVTDIQVVKD